MKFAWTKISLTQLCYLTQLSYLQICELWFEIKSNLSKLNMKDKYSEEWQIPQSNDRHCSPSCWRPQPRPALYLGWGGSLPMRLPPGDLHHHFAISMLKMVDVNGWSWNDCTAIGDYKDPLWMVLLPLMINIWGNQKDFFQDCCSLQVQAWTPLHRRF